MNAFVLTAMALSTQAELGFLETFARIIRGFFLQCGSHFGVVLDGLAIEIAPRNVQNTTCPADAVPLPRFPNLVLFLKGLQSFFAMTSFASSIHCAFGVHLLQAMIHCFEIFQALELFAIHADVFLSPIVERRLTDSMISTNFDS